MTVIPVAVITIEMPLSEQAEHEDAQALAEIVAELALQEPANFDANLAKPVGIVTRVLLAHKDLNQLCERFGVTPDTVKEM